MALKRCVICGKAFSPDRRSRLQQKCCGRRCSRRLKHRRDRVHKQRYRETGLGQEQRKRENKTYRERVGWNEYMRFWRKAEPKKRARKERERARRYYKKHKAEILQKRCAQHVSKTCAQKGAGGACSH